MTLFRSMTIDDIMVMTMFTVMKIEHIVIIFRGVAIDSSRVIFRVMKIDHIVIIIKGMAIGNIITINENSVMIDSRKNWFQVFHFFIMKHVLGYVICFTVEHELASMYNFW